MRVGDAIRIGINLTNCSSVACHRMGLKSVDRKGIRLNEWIIL